MPGTRKPRRTSVVTLSTQRNSHMPQIEQQEPSHELERRDVFVYTGYALGAFITATVVADVLLFDDSAAEVAPKGIAASLVFAGTEFYRRRTRTAPPAER